MAKLTIQGNITNPLTIGGGSSRADANIVVTGSNYVEVQSIPLESYTPTLSVSKNGKYIHTAALDHNISGLYSPPTLINKYELKNNSGYNKTIIPTGRKSSLYDGMYRAYDSISNSNEAWVIAGCGSFANTTYKNSGVVHVYNTTSSPVQILTNPDGFITNNFFGKKVCISDDAAMFIVGAPSSATTPTVHVYTKPASTWTRLLTLTSIDAQQYGLYGDNIVCSTSGDCIAIAEPNYSSTQKEHVGRIHVYDSFVQGLGITAPYQTETNFGSRMDMSSDGNTIIVGGNTNIYIYNRNISDEWDLVKTISPPNSTIDGIKCIALSGDGRNIAVTYYSNAIDPFLKTATVTQFVSVYRNNAFGAWVHDGLIGCKSSPIVFNDSHYHIIADTDGLPTEKYGAYGNVGELKLLRGKDVGLDQVYDYNGAAPYIKRNISFFTIKNGNYTNTSLFKNFSIIAKAQLISDPSVKVDIITGPQLPYFSLSTGSDPDTGMSVLSMNYQPNTHRYVANSSLVVSLGINDATQNLIDTEASYGDNIKISSNGDHIYFTSREPKNLYHFSKKAIGGAFMCDVSTYTGLPSGYVAGTSGPEQNIDIRFPNDPDLVFLIPSSPNFNNRVQSFCKKVNTPFTHTDENNIASLRNSYTSLPVTMMNSSAEDVRNGKFALDQMDNNMVRLNLRRYNYATTSYDKAYSNEEYNSSSVSYDVVSLTENMVNLQIIEYTGTGTNADTYTAIPHDLDNPICFIMIKNISTDGVKWMVWHENFPNGTVSDTSSSLPFNVGSNNDVSYLKPTDLDIHVYGDISQNLLGESYVAYVFSQAGNNQVETGIYNGTGGANALGSIYVPHLLMIKNITDNSPWVMVTPSTEYYGGSNRNAKTTILNGTGGSQVVSGISFDQDGKVTLSSSNPQFNADGSTYAYVMFMGGH